MARRYRKIDPRTWKDEGFRSLSMPEKLTAIYCITAQSNRIGIFSFSPALAAEDLETFPETFQEGFQKACETLSWRWDSAARVLYLPTWWKYNLPENPNVLKGCLADLGELPKTPLLAEFCSNLRYLPETLHQTFRDGLPKPSGNQEQEQEQEQEPLLADKPPRKKGASKTPKAPKNPRERNLLFDAVARVTQADPIVAASHIQKVVNALKEAEPPYTPQEVLLLPEVLKAAGFTFAPTLGSIETHIGRTRTTPGGDGRVVGGVPGQGRGRSGASSP